MAIFGIDYAWSRPTVAAMKAAKVEFVCRYLSNDTTGKNLSRAEATTLSDAGIWMVVVWETTAARALAGRQAGRDDALQALYQARALGMPEDRPIYFAVDFNAGPADFPKIKEYFTGVASTDGTLGKARVGMYGGYVPIKWAFDNNLITYGWQTYAWSDGQWDARAQLQQYQNGMKIGGADVDYDQAMATDYGQWQIGVSSVALTEPDKTWLLKTLVPAVASAVWRTDNLIKAADNDPANTHWTPGYHLESLSRITRETAQQVATPENPEVMINAIVAKLLAVLSPEQLAEAIAGHLGTSIAAEVAEALRARLES